VVAAKRLTTAERLQELAWAGYGPEEISAAAGVTAEDLEEGAPGWSYTVMRAWNRLAPPDIDEIAVERVLDGDYPPCRLTAAERREAVRQLRLCRAAHREIADRLSVTPRTVDRIIVSLGLAEQGAVTT
jgi:hypothetical protein